MGRRDITRLKPLFSKHLKKPIIYSFDIETSGENNDFYMGGIYGPEGYQSFYNKEEMLKEFRNSKYYGKNTYVVATNLAFDLVGIYYNTEEWNNLDIVMSGGRMIFAKKKNKQRQTLTFIDTFNYAPFSVALMGKILGLPKLDQPRALGKIPQNDEEKEELEIYNIRDCEVTHNFMQLLSKGFFNAGGKLKTTIASTAMDIFRRKYLRAVVKKEETVLGENVNHLLFSSYYGGRTEVFKRGRIENMKLYDINSLYPSVMINEYPDPNYTRKVNEGTRELLFKYEGVCKVKIYCPEMKYPLLPTRMNGKLIFPTGTFEGVYTHVELRRALKLGYKILNYGECVYYKKTFYPFKEYVLDLYEKRMELKKKKDPNELVYKLLLNSLYGKFAQKNLAETVFFNKKFLTDEQIEKLRTNPDVLMTDDDNGMIITKKECEESFVFPVLSSYTTAYARILLHKYLTKYNAVYCDTDSIITTESMPESNRLGDMKLEYVINEGLLVKPKMYYLETPEKNIIKLKGVPKKIRTENGKAFIDKEQFFKIVSGLGVTYDKFTKLKEGVRRNITPNRVIQVEKFITTNDNKREWSIPFSIESLGDSEPICLI